MLFQLHLSETMPTTIISTSELVKRFQMCSHFAVVPVLVHELPKRIHGAALEKSTRGSFLVADDLFHQIEGHEFSLGGAARKDEHCPECILIDVQPFRQDAPPNRLSLSRQESNIAYKQTRSPSKTTFQSMRTCIDKTIFQRLADKSRLSLSRHDRAARLSLNRKLSQRRTYPI